MWKSSTSMKLQKSYLTISLVIAVFFVSACSGLNRSDKPATTSWWLDAYGESTFTSTSEPPVKVDVSVSVVPGLDSHRILTLADNAEMNKYAGARWADSLPELAASLVSRSLEASGRFVVVAMHGGAEECDLELEVQEFYARLDSAGQTSGVRVALNGRYLCDGAEPVHIRLNQSVAVHDERMSVIVAAFQQAVDEVMKELLETI
jgi:ABC-type uncharacterized transport system auxiliary subunit